MLVGRHRFHGYNSLRLVYKNGQSARSQMLSLRYLHRDPTKPYRVAVVVSRKVSKSAVMRNRMRRRVYEAVRSQADVVPPGTDLVFTVYTDQLATAQHQAVAQAVQKLLGRAARSS